MSTTEELLTEMEQSPELYADSDDYCMLESDTSRVVVVPERYKVFGVEGDANVERIKFKFPKIVGDNVDLTTLNLRVNFQNANGKLDKYLVDDVEEAEDGYITFSWIIQDGLTPKKGTISFVVQALKATSDGKFERKWSTTLNKVGQILEGLEVDEVIAEQNPDIIEAILTRLDELKKGGGGSGTVGKDGREIELQNSGTAIQWRYVGEEEWKDLVQLSELKGEKGEQGDKGDPGSTPNIKIGEVTTLESGQQATTSITGTPEEPILNLGIPKGEKGQNGDTSEPYELHIMSDTQLGGGKAVAKTNETVPVAVDPETGQLFVPTYQESGGGSSEKEWVYQEIKTNPDTLVYIISTDSYKEFILCFNDDSSNGSYLKVFGINIILSYFSIRGEKTIHIRKLSQNYFELLGNRTNDSLTNMSVFGPYVKENIEFGYSSVGNMTVKVFKR